MQEILAENLQSLFDNTSLIGKKTYSGEIYEVWEVSDEVFESMCNMSDDEFEKLCPKGMWRSSEGSVMDIPDTEFIINGEKLIGWNTRGRYENYQYANLSDYLCYGIGASQPKNVCALAVDLAKYNNMTMGELFTKYEG